MTDSPPLLGDHVLGAGEIDDVRVCELGVAIREAQRREAAEMEWLIEDIERNVPR